MPKNAAFVLYSILFIFLFTFVTSACAGGSPPERPIVMAELDESGETLSREKTQTLEANERVKAEAEKGIKEVYRSTDWSNRFVTRFFDTVEFVDGSQQHFVCYITETPNDMTFPTCYPLSNKPAPSGVENGG